MAGRAILQRKDGSVIDLTSNSEGILIPNMGEVLSVDLIAAQWIVVIEKEASPERPSSTRWFELLLTKSSRQLFNLSLHLRTG